MVGRVVPLVSSPPRCAPASTAVARTISAAAFILVWLAQLSSFVHMGVVRHERCLEHGELVERHEASSSTSAQWSEGLAVLRSAPGFATDEHDHCPLVTTSVVPHADLAARHVELPRAVLPEPNTPEASVRELSDLLAYAPKTSPPART